MCTTTARTAGAASTVSPLLHAVRQMGSRKHSEKIAVFIFRIHITLPKYSVTEKS
jgi:hypothetical protein